MPIWMVAMLILLGASTIAIWICIALVSRLRRRPTADELADEQRHAEMRTRGAIAAAGNGIGLALGILTATVAKLTHAQKSAKTPRRETRDP